MADKSELKTRHLQLVKEHEALAGQHKTAVSQWYAARTPEALAETWRMYGLVCAKFSEVCYVFERLCRAATSEGKK